MDVEIPVTLTGHLAQRGIKQVRNLKRQIRNTPALWQVVRAMRKLKG